MTKEQRQLVELIQHKENGNIQPNLNIILKGSAGTGKSFLIDVLKHVLKEKVLVTATTGVAAFNVKGRTIHKVIKLPCSPDETKVVTVDELNSFAKRDFQEKWEKVKWLFIDEMSMLGQRDLFWVDKRLRTIKGVDELFGGINVVLIGDFHQLPPVSDYCLFDPPTGSSHDQNKHGHILYNCFKRAIVLEKVKRQDNEDEEGEAFVNLLKNIREFVVTKEDWKTIQTRTKVGIPGSEYPDEKRMDNMIHLKTQNEDCRKHNYEKLQKLGTKIAKCVAEHPNNDKASKKADDEKIYGLEKVAYYAKGAKVMLRVNLCQPYGLINGACGTVKDIIYHPGEGPPTKLPKAVIVEFPDYTGPPLMCPEEEQYKHMFKYVPITSFTGRKGSQARRQIPLRLAWAITIWKSQGLTLDEIHVNVGAKEHSGLIYVAFSRVKRFQNIFVDEFNFPRYQKILYDKDGKIKNGVLLRREEEKRLKKLHEKTVTKLDKLNAEYGTPSFS